MSKLVWADPFDEPLAYWRMVKNCPVTKEHEKRKQLRAVGLDFDVEPQAKESAA